MDRQDAHPTFYIELQVATYSHSYLWLTRLVPSLINCSRELFVIKQIVNIQRSVVEILEVLPPDKQQELLRFAESLQAQNMAEKPRKSLKGIWSDLEINLTEEDLAEARREMWGDFPKSEIVD